MLLNKDTKIFGKNIILVPYKKEHVLQYHEWMKSEELQKLTASEPLMLEKEFEMQQSWMTDNNKCTFIILDRDMYESSKDEIKSMIGDTNLFFCDDSFTVAEAEIMIAKPEFRGLHRGREAILMMLFYGIKELNVKQFIVKISLENIISIKMFEKIGFIETSTSVVFNEITMEKLVDSAWTDWIKNNIDFDLQRDNFR